MMQILKYRIIKLMFLNSQMEGYKQKCRKFQEMAN